MQPHLPPSCVLEPSWLTWSSPCLTTRCPPGRGTWKTGSQVQVVTAHLLPGTCKVEGSVFVHTCACATGYVQGHIWPSLCSGNVWGTC